jgi:outer membrane protein TolC
MKLIVLAVLLMVSFANAVSQETHLSLKDILELAKESSPVLVNANLTIEHSEMAYRNTKGGLYPQIGAFSTFTYNYSIPKMIIPGEVFGQSGPIPVEIGTKYDWNSGLEATQVLFSQSYFSSIKMMAQMTELSRLNRTLTEEELVHSLSRLFFLSISLEQQISAIDSAIVNMTRISNIARLQSEGGIIRQVDYSRTSIEKNNLDVEKDLLTMHLNQQMNMLKYLVGLDKNTSLSLNGGLDSEFGIIGDGSFNAGMRTESKILNQQLSIAKYEQMIDRQSALPEISLFARHYYQGLRDEFDFFDGGRDRFFKAGYVGLQISVPLFDGMQRRSKLKMKRIALQKLMHEQENLSNQLDREHADAILQHQNCERVLINRQQNVQVANEVFKVNLNGYHQGVVSLTDLLISENQLTKSRIDLIDASFQLIEAELDLQRVSGSMISGN